jgi:hypothetical protein
MVEVNVREEDLPYIFARYPVPLEACGQPVEAGRRSRLDERGPSITKQ